MKPTSIYFTEDKNQIYLNFVPPLGSSPLDLHGLQALLSEHGFAQCAMNAVALEAGINDCNTRTEAFQLEIGRRVDAGVAVQVAPDEMSAHITLSNAQGGKALVPIDIVRALKDAGVEFGIDPSAIVNALTHEKGDPVVVATGRPVAHGNNAVFEILVTLAGSQTPTADAEGHVDYREHVGISMVVPDMPLVRRTPATAGVEGMTVKGKTIAPNAGRDDPFPNDLAGTKFLEDDANLLVSAIAGHPVGVANAVYVDPLIRVPEVNLATGHIHFTGAVQVDGDVTQGMKIKATGNVMVGGLVEASSIETDGDILIKGGVIAHAQLIAGGMVLARFAEGASIFAGKNIVIEEMALECNMQAQDQITVGLKVPQRGRLVGGIAKALLLIKAPFIGSDKGGLTRVIVGVHEALENRHRELQFSISDKQNSEESLRKIINQLTKIGDPKKMLDRAKASLLETQRMIIDMEKETNMIDEKLNHLRQSKVEVTQGSVGTVEVTIANHKVRLSKDYGRGKFTLSEENRILHVDTKGFSGLAT